MGKLFPFRWLFNASCLILSWSQRNERWKTPMRSWALCLSSRVLNQDRQIHYIPVAFHAAATSPGLAVKEVNLGTSQNMFPFHLSLRFQRIIKTPSMVRWFPFLVSEHLVTMQLYLFWSSQVVSCFGSHVRHCHTHSHLSSAANPGGGGGVHPRAHPPHTSFCHSWTFPSHQLSWPTNISPSEKSSLVPYSPASF